jgi:hypothetical protein
MNMILGIVILGGVLAYLTMVHSFYGRQKRVCGTYPYYRLRDRIIWEMLQDPDRASEKARLYEVLNRIVHHADRLGWRFISDVVQEVTHAIMEKREVKQPAPLEVELVGLVVASAKANSLVVKLALTGIGRLILLYPVTKACYQHFKKQNPGGMMMLTRRVETVRRVRRLNSWRQTAMGTAA